MFLNEIKPDFEKDFQIIRIGLFGSYARDEQTEKSDIDLIVEFAPGTEGLSEKKEKIKYLIKSKFKKEVDVAREKYLKPYYKNQIIKSAIYV